MASIEFQITKTEVIIISTGILLPGIIFALLSLKIESASFLFIVGSLGGLGIIKIKELFF